MNVDAVFFDAGNTLIYPDPPVGAAYARALRREGIEADPEEVGQRFEEAWLAMREQQEPDDLEYGRTEGEALDWWRKVVRETCRHFGMPRDFEAMFQALWEYFASGAAWGVYDDVVPTLRELRRRGKGLGVISNWDVRLADVLREVGLQQEFDWVLISACVGVEKPDPAIFQQALRGCGLPAERVLHVGDTREDDFVGAREAGLQALWLRRETTDCGGDAVIASLTELLDLLD